MLLALQRAYAERSRFQLLDSAAYWLDRARAIAAPGYVPSVEDVMRVRVRTSGILGEWQLQAQAQAQAWLRCRPFSPRYPFLRWLRCRPFCRPRSSYGAASHSRRSCASVFSPLFVSLSLCHCPSVSFPLPPLSL